MSQTAQNNPETINVCLLNPALLPGWFWHATAESLTQSGVNCTIPEVRRGDPDATMKDNVTTIAEAMDDRPNQYIVALSRGVEYAVRYIDRLAKQHKLHRALGWMIISSVGPRGYEVASPSTGTRPPRHTEQYIQELSYDEQGLEIISPQGVKKYMLHDVEDAVSSKCITELVRERPLTQQEINAVPRLRPGVLPLAWYIGLNDRVDNQSLSAVVAQQQFGVDPTYTHWGHVGPLSHTEEVADAILSEAQLAQTLRDEERS